MSGATIVGLSGIFPQFAKGKACLDNDLIVTQSVARFMHESFIDADLNPARQTDLDFGLKELRRTPVARNDTTVKEFALDFPRAGNVKPRRRQPGRERALRRSLLAE